MATQHYCARYWGALDSPIDTQVATEFSPAFADEIMRLADGDDIFIGVERCGGVRRDELFTSVRTGVSAVQRIPTPEISAFAWTRNRFDLRMRAHRGDNYVECH